MSIDPEKCSDEDEYWREYYVKKQRNEEMLDLADDLVPAGWSRVDPAKLLSDVDALPELASALFFELCEDADLAFLQELLARGADINFLYMGETPLTRVCLRGDLAKVEFLLQHGADPDGEGLLDRMPLHIAAVKGDGELIRLLLRYGANIDVRARIDYYDTAVWEAFSFCRGNQEETIRLLLDLGADPRQYKEGDPPKDQITSEERQKWDDMLFRRPVPQVHDAANRTSTREFKRRARDKRRMS